MCTERTLWRGATTMAIGILLLMMLQARPEHRDTTTPQSDEPGAAARVCSPLGSTTMPAVMGWCNYVIALDPRDPNRVWAAGVEWFRSDDGGRNRGLASLGYFADNLDPQANYLFNLPLTCDSIVIDPDDRQRLYLGTDLGVIVSIDGGNTWMTEETGFGPAVTMWLSLIRTPAGQKQLFAFTHGRGAWRVTLR